MLIRISRPLGLSLVAAFALAGSLMGPDDARSAYIDPLLHYSFDAADTSGTTVADLGTGGNDGTIFGTGVTSTTGVFNEAASISGGGSNYISSGTALLSTSNASQPYTIAFWMKSDGRKGAPVSQYDGSGSNANRFMITNNDQFSGAGELVWWHGNIGERGQTGINVSDNTFHHVAFVKNASQQLSIYVDGALNQAGTPLTDTIAFMNTNFEVGRGSSTVHGYTGLVDELFVFSQALTAGEVYNLYALNNTVPEPSTLVMLLGLAAAGLLGYVRSRRKAR